MISLQSFDVMGILLNSHSKVFITYSEHSMFCTFDAYVGMFL